MIFNYSGELTSLNNMGNDFKQATGPDLSLQKRPDRKVWSRINIHNNKYYNHSIDLNR